MVTDSKALIAAMCDAGIKITALAKKIGITRTGFYKKINNQSEFKASEISTIQNVLNLSNTQRDEIFFAKKVE